MVGAPKVTDLAKLVWRASILIQEAAEGLESANASADSERQWLADYQRLVEQGKQRRGRGGRRE